MKKSTKLMIAGGIASSAAAISTYSVARYFFNYAIVRNDKRKKGGSETENTEQIAEYKDIIEEGKEWIKQQKKKTVYMKSRDGLILAADLIMSKESKGVIILSHGYRSTPFSDFSCIAKYYYDKGYSLLLIYHRACGKSQGKYITFGVKESEDIADWAHWTSKRFGKRQDIFLHGLSMGSTAVLMACDSNLPDEIRGIIADCGFTTPRDIFKHLIEKDYPIMVLPLLSVMERIAKKKAHFSFSEKSTIVALERNKIPVLFVHGDQDDFVPTKMTYDNYNACESEKEIIIIQGAKHGMSYLIDSKRCQKVLDSFLEKHGRN